MDKVKKIEELKKQIEMHKANMNACSGAITILEEQIKEEMIKKDKPKDEKEEKVDEVIAAKKS